MNVAVYKFGGASLGTAERISLMAPIIASVGGRSLTVVVSAIGKTTNALEEILACHREGDAVGVVERFNRLKEQHVGLAWSLIPEKEHPVFAELDRLFEELRTVLRKSSSNSSNDRSARTGNLQQEYPLSPDAVDSFSPDALYDAVVGFGELFSTAILHPVLVRQGFEVVLFDARQLIRTNSDFRDARVDWKLTQLAVQRTLFPYFQHHKGAIALTQGFIGSDAAGHPTTLGREGSDFTAAILGYCMRVKEITIWKDVPGILNADPDWLPDAVKLNTLSYHEVVELAYYGARVVHPKTIKPLKNAGILLHVRSFFNPSEPGTTVRELDEWEVGTPVFIRKQNQVLISVTPHDFSFMDEKNMSNIFTHLSRYRVKAHVMQHSAISLSVCTDNLPGRIRPLMQSLRREYLVRFNENLELITIRHYTKEAIGRMVTGRTILLEQRSRHTIHLVMQE